MIQVSTRDSLFDNLSASNSSVLCDHLLSILLRVIFKIMLQVE
jgi:hypothetical protein